MNLDLVRKLVWLRVNPCTRCGAEIPLERVEFLGREGETWAFSVLCPHCFALGMVGVHLSSEGASIQEGGEAAKDPDQPPPTADEVLDLYQRLKAYRGDLRSLLEASASEPTEAPRSD